MNFSRGAGPHATPLVVGNRLFAAATDKQFFALDKKPGKVIWSHNFVKEYDAPPNQMKYAIKPGYAPSPIATKTQSSRWSAAGPGSDGLSAG
jgi:glucose dehydrogenase